VYKAEHTFVCYEASLFKMTYHGTAITPVADITVSLFIISYNCR